MSTLRATARRLLGQSAESAACAHLRGNGLHILARNVRYRGGEIDIVARDGAVLVFVEVRARTRPGLAAASINRAKRGKIRLAAQLYLLQRVRGPWPACRFDVIVVEGGAVQWLRAAFDANEE